MIGNYDTGGTAVDIQVSGNFAYIADGEGEFLAIDVSNPSQPILASTTQVPGNPYHLKVTGNYAYVASSTPGFTNDDPDEGLQIIDISDPSNPIIVGRFLTHSLGYFDISSNHAYALNGSSIVIIDISDATNPVELSSIAAHTLYTRFLKYINGYVYTSSNNFDSVQIIDATDPLNPVDLETLVITAGGAGDVEDLYVEGGYAYAVFWAGYGAGLAPGIQIIDINDPANPELAGFFFTDGDARAIHVTGQYAYIGSSDTGLNILDISEKNGPPPYASQTYASITEAHTTNESGDIAYVATHDDLLIVDVTNPENQTILGSVPLPDWGQDIVLSGNIAYVATFEHLNIIDISTPTLPVLVSTHTLSANISARSLSISNGHAYIVGDKRNSQAGDEGLEIIDISNPANPNTVTTMSSFYKDVHTSGQKAYLVTHNTFKIVDMTNPTAPVTLSETDLGSGQRQISAEGSYAYVLGIDGLKVLDVTNPLLPTLITNYHRPNTFVGYDKLHIADGRAYYGVRISYATEGRPYIEVVDISNPTTPFLDHAYNARGGYVSTAGQNIYISGTTAFEVLLKPSVSNIETVDVNTITATFSAGLPVGPYHVKVVNPSTPSQAAHLYNGFTIGTSPPQLTPPTILPATLEFHDNVLVDMTYENAQASIHYTLDGSTPTTASALFADPFYLYATTTVKAIAIDPEYGASTVSTSKFAKQCTNQPWACNPSINPIVDAITNQSVDVAATIQIPLSSTSPSGDVITWNIIGLPDFATLTDNGDGTAVISASPVLLDDIGSYTLTVEATDSQGIGVQSFTLNVTNPPSPPPALSPDISGELSFWNYTTITLSSTMSGATIYYTLDGSEPTTTSTQYLGPFEIWDSLTLKAIAIAQGYSSSASSEEVFTDKCTNPWFPTICQETP